MVIAISTNNRVFFAPPTSERPREQTLHVIARWERSDLFGGASMDGKPIVAPNEECRVRPDATVTPNLSYCRSNALETRGIFTVDWKNIGWFSPGVL